MVHERPEILMYDIKKSNENVGFTVLLVPFTTPSFDHTNIQTGDELNDANLPFKLWQNGARQNTVW